MLPYLILFLTWCLVHVGLVIFRDIPVFEAGLVGPDSYMRMLRVSELFHSWDWFDSTIDRANAPYGDTLHWTRPFDLLIIALALPASLAVGPDQALYLAGIVVSPLLQLATALALIWALRPLIRPEVWFLPVIALFLQPGALAYSILGRADHHTLLLLLFVILAGFVVRALRNPLDARPALFGGATAGLGVWLSVEFLLPTGLCLAALGVPWLTGERERAAQNKWFSFGFSAVLLVALFAERPLESLLEPSYDSVSAVQLLIAACILLFWRAAEAYERTRDQGSRWPGRCLLSVIGLGALILLVDAVYPLFFAGPMGEVDPRIRSIWLDHVTEMGPVLPQDRVSLGKFVFYLGAGLIVIPALLRVLVAEYGTARFWPLFFTAFAGAGLWAVATLHVRFSGYAELAFILGFAVVLDRFLRWSARIGSDLLRGVLRGGFLTAMLLGPIIVGSTLMSEENQARSRAAAANPGCDLRGVSDYLNSDPRWSAAPQTILTFLDIGPELLYRTPHEVIATPYHRNGDGIYDSHRIMTSRDDGEARRLMARRGIDLVLLCQLPAERAFFSDGEGDNTLYRRLDAGDPPTWLTPVPLPPELQARAKLYHRSL
ncbi:MAG: hypothetical protein Tsb0032_08140 [Kiloniellaceae bacterium]